MEHRLSPMLVLLILAVLVLLIYEPLLELDRLASRSVHDHQTDSMQPGIEGSLSFCSDFRRPYVDTPGGGEGYVIDLLLEVYEPLGDKVTMEVIPWNLCLEAVDSGIITGAIGASRQEAPGLIFPEESIGQFRPLVYTLSRFAWSCQGMTTLDGIRLGILQGHSYSDDLDAYIVRLRQAGRVKLRNGEQAVELLLDDLQEGRIEASVADSLMVDVSVAKNPEIKQVLRAAGFLSTEAKLYVVFSPVNGNSFRLRQSYDRRINKFRENGFLITILDRYDLKDWQRSPDVTTQKQL